LNYNFIKDFKCQARGRWARLPLQYTSLLRTADALQPVGGDSLINVGSILLPQPHPDQDVPAVWACDGNRAPVTSDTRSVCTLVIVLSYPVNDNNFVLHANGGSICKTLRHVFNTLKPLNDEQRKRVLITDIFPYVGHPSPLGRQNLGDQSTMTERARAILQLKPHVIVASGQASRFAFSKAIYEDNLPTRDLDAALGVPSCLVTQNGTPSIIIIEPHPSLATMKGMRPIFARRAALIRFALGYDSREDIESVSTGIEIQSKEKFRKQKKTCKSVVFDPKNQPNPKQTRGSFTSV
jgi:hypothetical protein